MNIPQSPPTQAGGTATVDSIAKLRLLGPRAAMSAAARRGITVNLTGLLAEESDDSLLDSLGEISGVGTERIRSWVKFVRPVSEVPAEPPTVPPEDAKPVLKPASDVEKTDLKPEPKKVEAPVPIGPSFDPNLASTDPVKPPPAVVPPASGSGPPDHTATAIIANTQVSRVESNLLDSMTGK